jgi:hypothetical protein
MELSVTIQVAKDESYTILHVAYIFITDLRYGTAFYADNFEKMKQEFRKSYGHNKSCLSRVL